ncbi:FIG00649149: hypothetical protein [hydrothermal vent metagenome]|uniref:Outer membrane protein beta-barrel domain-containing protein n=1 Tax=hydrothermal vent metagenome TaxID=652676 RepID=A0A3B0TTW3_9ZZZZ
MGKKNIDKLFQEKFKNFSEASPEKVWASIESSLSEKKKSRKIIPFWWKLGGVAALLAISLYVFNPFKSAADISNPVVTGVENIQEKESEEKEIENSFEKPTFNDVEIVDVEKQPDANHQNDIDEGSSNQTIDTDVRVKSTNTKNVTHSDPTDILNEQENQIANVKRNNQSTEKVGPTTSTNTNLNSNPKNNEASIAEVDKVDKRNSLVKQGGSNGINTDSKSALKQEIIEKTEKEAIAQLEKKTVKEDVEEPKKKSIFDEVASQKEEEVLAENSESKWSAGPSIAPVYYDAIGEGSPISAIFVPNSKSGNINLSYGLSVAYEISKKLSIRSGLHKVDYGYNTNDVEFSSSFGSVNGQIANVDYTLASKNIVVGSKTGAARAGVPSESPLFSSQDDVSAKSASREGIMAQELEYLEMPLELNYTLVDNRLGISLIAGVSSLFLIDNSISLTSGELTTEVGEANNLNNVDFSTNIGFGINYTFTNKVQFNIEPVFKYHLNTFSETDGAFQPFSVGVYSGLSFKF